jgi:hypothetical protein
LHLSFTVNKENDMPVSLTPQEKKVLGFVLFLLVFGLVVLGVKHWRGDEGKAGVHPVLTPESSGQNR